MPQQNNKKLTDYKLNPSLEQNITQLKEIFQNDETIIYRRFENPNNTQAACCVIFSEGMVNNDTISENIIRPITSSKFETDKAISLDFLQANLIISNNISNIADMPKLVEAVLSGDSILLLENYAEALIISSMGWQSRSIEEPQAEKVLRGPREGFTESLSTNISLVRRRLKTNDLKFKFITIGERSQTKGCVCYLESLVNDKILNETFKRINEIKIDGVLDTGTLQELIRDSPYSPFRTVGSSERPDTVAAKLLEGRVSFFLDGSPVALTVPCFFIELFQSGEDYYINYFFASINRIIRILAFLISISVPALYLALVTFHQEIIPSELIVSIASARQGVPFPTIVEELGLLLVFEILRETGTRLPSYVGQALSIVGALVIGQAAVDAKFVSAPIIIVIAIAGITGLMLPRAKGAAITLRVLFIVLASILGLYGILFGFAGLLLHLFSLRSFGMPYMDGLATLNTQDIKDTAIRAPWWFMKSRPRLLGKNNSTRIAPGEKNK